MRMFLDECIDWRLSRDLIGQEVKTARDMGWRSISNGELLALASQTFDAFVTVDRNSSFQQNLAGLTIAVMVLRAPTNRLADLKRLLSKLLRAIDTAGSGFVTIVEV